MYPDLGANAILSGLKYIHVKLLDVFWMLYVSLFIPLNSNIFWATLLSEESLWLAVLINISIMAYVLWLNTFISLLMKTGAALSASAENSLK